MKGEAADDGGAPLTAERIAIAVALAAVVLVAFIVRLRLAMQDATTLVIRTTPDDAYYYFQIARNIADGHNITFDGETVTNGFHPLWLALITPVYVFADGLQAVHIILVFGAALGAATALLVGLILLRLGCGAFPALLGAAFFALQPRIAADAVNGVESAIVVAMFALVVWLFVDQDGRTRAWPADVALGAAFGLMVLARTDTIFIVPPVAAYVLWRAAPAMRVRHAGVIGTSLLAVLTPWLLWSLFATGTVLQISGVASGWFAREAYLNLYGDSFGAQAKHSLELVRETLLTELPHKYFVPHSVKPWPVLVLAAAAAATAWFLLPAAARSTYRRRLTLVAIPALGIIAGLIFHAGYRWQVREWYYAPAAVAGALLLGVHAQALEDAVSHLARTRGPRVAAALAATATAMLFAAMLLIVQPTAQTRWVFYTYVQANHLETARWLEANTEPDDRVGSFNAGIIGYFSDRTVVNLDGVVNANAWRALKSCRMPQYIRERRLSYVADLPSALQLASCGESSGAYTLVVTIGVEIPWPDRGLLQVIRVEPPPSGGP